MADVVTVRVWLTVPQRHVCCKIDLAAIATQFRLDAASRGPRAIELVGRVFRVEKAKREITSQFRNLSRRF